MLLMSSPAREASKAQPPGAPSDPSRAFENPLGGGIPIGTWDPSLALVMAGALAVTAAGYHVVLRRPRPVIADGFTVPSRRDVDRPLVSVAPATPTEKDRAIGEAVAERIPHGATIQCGIGGTANAVLQALSDHHHLGVHTERAALAGHRSWHSPCVHWARCDPRADRPCRCPPR